MAFADPAVVTIDSVANNLVRINQDNGGSNYRLLGSDNDLVMLVRNSSRLDKKTGQTIERHSVDLSKTIFATADEPAIRRHAYVVIENQLGDTPADVVKFATGLLAYLSASSGANITKMLNSES
ncbi:coat protein [ssRNA phage Gerhypos.2_4]|uniref:Coat protein n=2 Tax=Leviviricetes TaxID=2842243 RepID=A0A8S5KYF8_9VIRU|nr:coat protein [ssRNA phage Gerhypos.2_4]QDH87585.1 MAG: hypothetical protein H2Bulk34233_000002 [Leviviridae sp.]DAD50227.1 TPA_asm: coat protein [ssRNA phage Gerhypos.2_4]